MAVKEILKNPNPLLLKVSEEVQDVDDVKDLIQDLMDTLATSAIGVGLSAPQIGVHKRVVLMNCGLPKVLVNPRIINKSKDLTKKSEGCLSFPGREFLIERYKWVTIEFIDPITKQKLTRKFKGLEAQCIQHEINHLDGILIDSLEQ